jgi:hypothetical protein
MRKMILAMAAVSALAIGAPAAAQSGYVNSNADLRVDQLRARIQAGVQQGTITRAEAQPLRAQLRALVDLERRYRTGGFTAQERADLQQRTRTLRQQIRVAEGRAGYDRDDDDRWDDRDRRCPPGLEKRNNGCVPPGQVGRDGRWEDRRDDRDDRWEDRRDDRDDRWDDRRDNNGRIDANRDGYDDRDLNRDGRVDSNERRIADERWDGRDGNGRIDANRDGYDDRDLNRDGRVDSNERRIADERYDDRGNRGGIVDRVIDRVTGNNGLRVGQRVSADLGPVPYEHRNHYRDGNGVYYRSDGRRIYQIDARTHTVVRIYPI